MSFLDDDDDDDDDDEEDDDDDGDDNDEIAFGDGDDGECSEAADVASTLVAFELRLFRLRFRVTRLALMRRASACMSVEEASSVQFSASFLSKSASSVQKPPLPGSFFWRAILRKHLFSDKLWRIEFLNVVCQLGSALRK